MKAIRNALALGIIGFIFSFTLTGEAKVTSFKKRGEAPEEKVLTADHFSYTATILLPEQNKDQPFYQVELPQDIYQNSVHSHLYDLTVFNKEGLIVPHAFANKQEQVIKQVSFKRFPIAAPKDLFSESGLGGNNNNIHIRSESGLSITLPISSSQKLTENKKIWLLNPVGDEKDLSGSALTRIKNIQLQWNSNRQNWQGKTTLYVSQDLQSWSTLVNQFNIMELYADKEQGNTQAANHSNTELLSVNQIPITISSASQWNNSKPYYLLLMVESDSADIPELSQITAKMTELLPAKMVDIFFEPKMISANEVEYTLLFPKPFFSLTLQPQQPQSVIPISLSTRNSNNSYWRDHQPMTIYNMGNSEAGAKMNTLSFNNQLVQVIKIKSNLNLNPPNTPMVTGQRQAVTLVFNAQGEGPYLLVWGNKDKTDAPISIQQLIPSGWLDGKDDDYLPSAQLTIENINDDVLKTTYKEINNNKEPSDYAIWLWIGLIAAVLFLSLFTFIIVKEMKKEPK